MKKLVFPWLLALASAAAFSGCAKSRAVTRANSAIPPRDVASTAVSVTNSTANAVTTNPPTAAETSEPASTSGIRLVSGDEDSAVPSSPLDGSTPATGSRAVVTTSTIAMLQPAMVTLAQLEEIAMQNNPTLVQAQAEIEVDQGFLKQAGLRPNPQLGYYNETASNPMVRRANGIFVSREFVTHNKLDLAQQAIRLEINQMEWDREAQRMRVINDLKIRYYEVLGAQQALVIARKLVSVASETVELTQRLLVADATRPDVLQAKIQLETARLSLDDAEYRYTAAWEQLVVIAGVPSMPPAPLSGDLMGEVPELDMETCWQRLLATSPQLGGSASQLDHGWAEFRSQCAQANPNFTIQAVVDYDNATNSTTASTLFAMPIPTNNRNQGNIDKASADIRLFKAEITRVELVLKDSLAEAFWRYKSRRRETERLKESILPNAEENLRLTREIFAAGQTNFNSVLTAQQTYFQSQMAYVEAVTALNKVVVEIEGLHLTGGLNPPAIGSAIQATPGGGMTRQRNLLKDVQDRAQRQLMPAAQLSQ